MYTRITREKNVQINFKIQFLHVENRYVFNGDVILYRLSRYFTENQKLGFGPVNFGFGRTLIP